jgi:hypothetical protein
LNRTPILASVLLLSPLGMAVLLFGYRDGPPPASTGGFGEPSCHSCHFDNPLSESSDSLTIEAPERFEAGKTYLITVGIVHEGMKNSGFQLSSRFSDSGGQAGVLRPLDSTTGLAANESDSISYIQHTREGQRLTQDDRGEWRFQWDAPMRLAPVIMHLAANAGNHDDSEFGDSVHTRELAILPTN